MRRTNPEKVKRAAAHPKRPGQGCKASPGTFHPTVDREKCEGKRDCEAVCPHDVFDVGVMTDADFKALSLLGKLKAFAHGKKTAYTPRADECQACGLCVVACPEKAIRLVEGAP
jgi:NAD-dependent dihydropyrimidine dehydrogenase PreA subunit